MSTSDYEIHLNQDRFDALFGEGESDSELFAFGEDADAIEKMIEEELGPPRRRGRPRKRSSY